MGRTNSDRSMGRRAFLAAGGSMVAGAACGPRDTRQAAEAVGIPFPRGETETFLNAAGGMPLTAFSEAGLSRYMDFIRLGPDEGRGDYFNTMWSDIRGEFAGLIGAQGGGDRSRPLDQGR